MFDFGFSELVVCGIVGLVVLGPERLPVVAKTAGQWIGKAQRFVQQMKDDINRESELAELKKIKDDAQHIAEDLNESVRSAALGIEKDVNSVAGEAQKNLNDAEKAYEADKPKVATGIDSFNDTPSAGTPTTAVGESTGAGAEQYSGTEFDSTTSPGTTRAPAPTPRFSISGISPVLRLMNSPKRWRRCSSVCSLNATSLSAITGSTHPGPASTVPAFTASQVPP